MLDHAFMTSIGLKEGLNLMSVILTSCIFDNFRKANPATLNYIYPKFDNPMKLRFLLPIFLMSLCIACKDTDAHKKKSNLSFFDIYNAAFTYHGRTIADDSLGRELITPGASIQFQTEGDSLVIQLASKNGKHNFVSIAVNGKYRQRYRVRGDSITEIPLKLSIGKTDTIGVFKATEASVGGVLFKGVKAKKIDKLVPKPLTIEFIGNSITCGYGADQSALPCEEGDWYDQHNAYLAYGPKVARALNVNFLLSSVSGIGMYRNWNDEDKPVMPDVYGTEYFDGNKDKTWDFSNPEPVLISIALGTNDLSEGDGKKERKPFNKEKFTQNYIDFLAMLYKRYPNVKIALLTSPMIQGNSENGKNLLSSLKKVKKNFEQDHTIAIFQFHDITPHGCAGHPSRKDHKKMASQLIPFYKKMLSKES